MAETSERNVHVLYTKVSSEQ